MSEPRGPAWTRWITRWPGILIATIWGTAEATLFFLIPDIPITLAAMFAPRRSLGHVGAVTIGSLIGGLIMYCWAALDSAAAVAAVDGVPFVSKSMLETVGADFQQYGVWALCVGPTSGIPYKAYAVLAPPQVALLPFLLVTVPARLERLLISWIMFALLAHLGRQRIARWPGRAVAIWTAYWIGVYIYYWSVI